MRSPRFTLALMLAMTNVSGGEIALTFDDAPLPGSPILSGDARTERLLGQLSASKSPPALFFATGKHIDSQSQARLRRYTDAGHYLANHSFDHLSANDVSPDVFMLDAYKMHLALKSFDRVLPLFRFPFLHYGSDADNRAQIAAAMTELG